MKYIILSISILAFTSLFGQTDTLDKHAKIFQIVEQMPEFPGGEQAMAQMIRKNIKYPKAERRKNIQGRVVVGFIVNEDGSISDISVKKGVSENIDKEAVRVVSLFPKFKPGKQQGKPVRVQFVLPIMFKLA